MGGGGGGVGGVVRGLVCGGDVIKSSRAIFFLLSVMRTNVPNTDGAVGGGGGGQNKQWGGWGE